MSRALCLVVLMVAACSGKKSTAKPGDGTGGGGGDVVTAQTLLGWGLQGHDPEAAQPATKVFLEVTDQNGATKSVPVGEAQGSCTKQAGNGTDVVTALKCTEVIPGVELRAMHRGNDIIVLSRRVDDANEPTDELAFQEVTRIPVPTGSTVRAAP